MTPTIKILLTGRLRVGKDYIAKAVDAKIIGFADPLYELGRFFLRRGPEDKDTVKGLREFYQKVGNWGRGCIDDAHPLSIERAIFTAWIRKLGPKIVPYVNWELYGETEPSGIWVDALLRQVVSTSAGRLAVSNCRFDDEFKRLGSAGFDHWHVMCSKQTYEERLSQVGLNIQSPELRHVSEKLAADLDNAVIGTLKAQPQGAKLKAIWNDHRPAPSGRLVSLEEFKKYVETYERKNTTTTEPSTGGRDDDQTPPATGAVTAKGLDS